MTPFILHAQTTVPSGTSLYNPPTFRAGLLGEQDCGYVVPAGKVLHIKRVTIESLWGAAIILYTGSATHDFYKSLDTFATGEKYANRDNETLIPTMAWDCDYYLPAGTQLNLRINNNWAPSNEWVYGWSVTGELLDA